MITACLKDFFSGPQVAFIEQMKLFPLNAANAASRIAPCYASAITYFVGGLPITEQK
jgi:hypothetical protein